MKFSALIFDMDGLMLDTERTYRDLFNRAAADCNIEFPGWLHEKLLGRNSADTHAILKDLWKDDQLFDRFIERSRHHYTLCFADPPPLKQGLLEILDFIEAKKIPKVVATSTRRAYGIPRLEKANLLHRFQSVTTGDQVQRGKPAPDIFLLAASTIPMEPSKCLVLEDSEAGVTAAHAAGMTVCMVPDLKQPCADVRSLAHGVYESLVDVRRYLDTVL
jgi:beta-phosphoglucomutase-like phosphatase (HAD superfamily)